MSIFALTCALLLTQPLPGDTVEPAEKNGQAETLEANPAEAITLAMAYANAGKEDRAREILAEVIRSPNRWRIETADGRWVDSRHLARRALLALDARAADGTQVASR